MNEKVIVVSIVENTYGTKVMKCIQEDKSSITSVVYGKGTVSNHILNVLGFYEQKKEITFSIIDQCHEDDIYNHLEKKLKLSKAGHGVLFSIPIRKVNSQEVDKEEVMNSKEAIFVVVENGKSEQVIESANRAGAQGGTIIHARGQSQVETKKLFHMDIEPEQEIVLIVAEKETGTQITNTITEDLKLNDGNNGHLFVLDVSRTSGFYKAK